jgi:hypothetical protein
MNHAQFERRFGKFIVPDVMYQPGKIEEVRGMMQLLDAVVVRAEHLYAENGIEYTAWAPIFPVVKEGSLVPFYHLQITVDADGKLVGIGIVELSNKEEDV